MGLDGLSERLGKYYALGARFAKWRAVITPGNGIPTDECIWNAYERDDIDKEGQLTKKEWIEFVRLHHKYDTEGTVSYEWICEEFERYVDDLEEDKEQIKYLDSMEDDDDEEEEFK